MVRGSGLCVIIELRGLEDSCSLGISLLSISTQFHGIEKKNATQGNQK